MLDGRKTETRKAIKIRYRPEEVGFSIVRRTFSGEYCYLRTCDEWEAEVRRLKDPYSPGDILYVRETWAEVGIFHPNLGEYSQHYVYKASYSTDLDIPPIQWRPSIHMPKKAARIFLRVNNVRVEQLQDMRLKDCLAEGVRLTSTEIDDFVKAPIRARERFAAVWNSTVKNADLPRYGWDANPWVWVIEFERISREKAFEKDSQGP